MILDTENMNLTRGHYLIATRYLGFTDDEEDILSPVAFQAQLKSIHYSVVQRVYRHDRADLATHLSANFKHSEKDMIKAIDAVHSLGVVSGNGKNRTLRPYDLFSSLFLAKSRATVDGCTLKSRAASAAVF